MNFGKWPALLILGTLFLGACNGRQDEQPTQTAALADSTVAVNSFPEFSSDTPAYAELEAAGNAAWADAARELRRSAGDAQHLEEASGMVWGVIQPNRHAQNGNNLKHGTLLARIFVDAPIDRGNLKLAADSNLWVAVQIPKGSANWYSFMVPKNFSQGNPPSLRPLAYHEHGEGTGNPHPGPVARWVVSANRLVGSTEAWATCDSNHCCCTGSSCDADL